VENSTNDETYLYSPFCTILPLPLRSLCSTQYPLPENSQSVCSLHNLRTVSLIQNNRWNYCFVYFNIYVFGYAGRQTILNLVVALMIGQHSAKNIHNNVNDIKDWNSRQKRYNGSILRKKLTSKNNDVPRSTEDKVYSAGVSPITKLLPDDSPYVAETCCNEKWMYKLMTF
jgi:hypothetical protein